MSAIELVFHNPENSTRVTGNSVPALAFSKSGTFRINKETCFLMHLNEGEKIEFVNTKDDPSKWFLYKSEKGFELAKKEAISAGLIFSNAVLASKIRESVKADTNMVKLQVIKPTVKLQGYELWPLELMNGHAKK